MHVSGMFMQKQYIDPIKQDVDPINDPINIVELSEREKKILELLRQDPTLTRAKMAGILGCSDATVRKSYARAEDLYGPMRKRIQVHRKRLSASDLSQ